MSLNDDHYDGCDGIEYYDTCPFAEEIHGDTTECLCCDCRRYQCALEI